MKFKSTTRNHRTRNFMVAFSLISLLAWLILPRTIRRAIQPTASAAAMTFTVNVTGDAQDANPGDGICATGAGNCSLRAAIQEANANPGKDTINFNIPGAGVHTIMPNTPLPGIIQALVIDGYSQPGASPNTLTNSDNAVLLIELSGANIATGADGLAIVNGKGTIIQGLVVNSFNGAGIVVQTRLEPLSSSETTIQGNFVGTDPSGSISRPNRTAGIFLTGTSLVQSNNTVGGITPATRNIVSGNGDGQASFPAAGIEIDVGGPNLIQGNFVGINAAGTAALSNEGDGVRCFFSFGSVIGGSAAARNIISGNGHDGILFSSGNEGHNRVENNFIGTNPDGVAAIPNAVAGVELGSPADVIGTPGNGNVISGNGGDGIFLTFNRNQIQGNLIGTDITGQNPLPNGNSGISITGADNLIGGAVGAGNTIAFNPFGGITIQNVGNAILSNPIFSNSGLGIDLVLPLGVNPNDPGDADTGPNNLQNFPVISSAVKNGSSTTVTGALDSSPNTSFTIQFFANPSCDPSGNGEGQTFLGSINQTTGADGHFMFSATVNAVPAGQFITATATDSGNNTSEFSQCVQVTSVSPLPTPTPSPSPTPTPTPTPSSTLQFGQSFYATFEDCTGVTITVARLGDTSNTASVDYATQPGTASDRSDFDAAAGTLRFAPGETAKSFDVLISEDSFTEGTESFTIALSNPVGATLGLPASASVQIFDDFPESVGNPIDVADDFVCQHYHDFLNREEDSSGAAFWTNEITSCGNNASCIQQKRVNTSGAFFLSIEFQETGGFAIRVQRAAFGKKSVDPATRMSYAQFIRDGRFVGDGVVVGQLGWDARLEANKQAYVNQLVASTAFTNSYGSGLTASQFVDALFAAAGVTPTAAERQNAINAFDVGGLAGRAAALRSVSDSNSLRAAEFRPSFALMQYFGFLRRNPTDAPDNNDNGYQFWLAKLNAFNGDFVQAEMVKAFITSFEYRARFGAP